MPRRPATPTERFALVALVLIGGHRPALGAEGGPAPVAVRLDPGPYYVGQAVGVRIEAPASSPGGAPTRVVPPRAIGADLIPVAGLPPGPPARFWLVPRRAGPLALPPFRAEAGEWGVGSRPVRITVAQIPQVGRPSSFGGGVGAFRVAARLEAGEVRPGRAVGLALAITGPAAIGGTGAPDLAAWADRPGAIEARLVGSDLDPADPPVRTFRYELRPRRAGRLTLPPILVASFDPASGRYSTRPTASLTLEVPPPPRFDPATIRPPARPSPALPPGWWGVALVPVGVALLGLGAALGLRHRRGAVRPARWRHEARRLARLDPEGPGWADRVATRFERLLAGSLRRPLAALTPPEAAGGVAALTGDENLAERAGRLVMALDRLRFGPSAGGSAADRAECRAAVIALLGAIADRSKRPGASPGRFGEVGGGPGA